MVPDHYVIVVWSYRRVKTVYISAPPLPLMFARLPEWRNTLPQNRTAQHKLPQNSAPNGHMTVLGHATATDSGGYTSRACREQITRLVSVDGCLFTTMFRPRRVYVPLPTHTQVSGHMTQACAASFRVPPCGRAAPSDLWSVAREWAAECLHETALLFS